MSRVRTDWRIARLRWVGYPETCTMDHPQGGNGSTQLFASKGGVLANRGLRPAYAVC